MDYVAIGIVAAAILLFVGTGAQVGPAVVRSLLGHGRGPDAITLNAFLLNIAIIIFGWSRYRELRAEIRVHVAAEREARHLAETDPLTGFLNRRSFYAAIDDLRATSERRGNALALMMVDIDNFKQVNDHNGHAAGDVLLGECALRIASVLPLGALVGRVGGDEFAIGVEFDPHHRENVDRIAAALVENIAQVSCVSALSIQITASIGIAPSDMSFRQGHAIDARALAEMADMAMYHAKRKGRNGFFWFEPSMADEMRLRSELEAGIRLGIANGEFVPFYEQQIDLKSGELIGFEMLARWNSPQFGTVAPDIFIPIAEEIGVIAALSERLIRQALEDAKGWNPKLKLAVNISPLQLRDPWFAQKLLRTLTEANFPPHRLELEITESCLHQNFAQVRSLITSLQNQGISVTLDDFGTGYSSLAQLRSLPFDRIKIDRSFVSNAAENQDSAAIVHAIAMLGQGLKLPITAEGIENDDVLEHLRQYEELSGQGYLYGRPRPADEIKAWLDTQPASTWAPAEGVLPIDTPPEKPALLRGQSEDASSNGLRAQG